MENQNQTDIKRNKKGNFMKFFKYLRYLVKHKWYVMLECFHEGLFWRGVTHDLSKFLPDEFFPYMNYFYGKKSKEHIQKEGFCKPKVTNDEKFDFAWLLHQKRNKHHWQWWVLPEDNGRTKVLEMPYPYLQEMICDWIGAGKAQGFVSPPNDKYYETNIWYQHNKNRIILHEKSRARIERILEGAGISYQHDLMF